MIVIEPVDPNVIYVPYYEPASCMAIGPTSIIRRISFRILIITKVP